MSTILGELSPFKNEQQILITSQDTTDIINAILKQHKKCEKEYDKIWHYYDGGDPVSTAENVFDYLKKNVDYVVESDDDQKVKSPSAIIATGKTTGSDCKNFALFTSGIMDAYRRNTGEDFGLNYRFAAYDGKKVPEHVFTVIVVDGEEYWVDPVLDYFNQHKKPSYYKDKNIKDMLSSLSGINYYGKHLGDDASMLEDASNSGDSMDSANYDNSPSQDQTAPSIFDNTTELPTGYSYDSNNNVFDAYGNPIGFLDSDGDFVDAATNKVYSSLDNTYKGYYDSDGDFVDTNNQVYGTDGNWKGYYDSDGDFVDSNNKVYGTDGNLKGSYDSSGNFTDLQGNVYNAAGNLIKSSSVNAPSYVAPKGGSPTGAGTSKGSSPSSNNINDLLKAFSSLLGAKTSPSYKLPTSSPTTANKSLQPATTTSSTSNILMYGLLIGVAFLFITGKSKK